MKKVFTLSVFALVFCGTALMAAPAYKVLVLTERGGQHGGFTDAALKWLQGQSKEMNFEFTEINNTQAVNEKYLSQFKLIIQLDYPPYTWTKDAEKAFIRYIDEGQGGWIGFHHATLLGEFDGYPLWHWFSDFMGGIRFQNYIAAKADATVRVEDTQHPVMKGVQTSFVIPDDEWYTFDKNPRPNVQVLANVDESTYKPASNIKMGDHPVIWVNPYKAARNVYFLIGHSQKLFDSKEFKKMFTNAIEWASASDTKTTHYPGNYAKAPRFKALVYYSEHVEEAHRKFAEQGVEFFRRLNYGDGFQLEITKTLTGYPYEKLKEYDVVVMLNNSPSQPAEREAFQKYMENGGGWMGFHAAAYNDKNTRWPWFVDFLGGAVFSCNKWPPQPAKLTIDYPAHPVTKNLPESFIAPESEWYQWNPSPRKNPGVDVLLSLSPDNYPVGIKDVVSSGDFPVVWTNKKYRMIYLNMGHGDDEFTDATQKLLFINAFRWVISQNKTGDPFKKEKIRLAFITGMNPQFKADLYAPVLDDFAGVTWKAYTNEESQELFKPQNKNLYDVIVFHDICLDTIPEATKQNIAKVISEGKPALILHDGLLTYNTWPEFEKIAGMKYFMSHQTVDGKPHGVSTYKHKQEIPITVVDTNHFITQGMDKNFVLNDEIYGNMWHSPDIHVLWTTTHPESDKEVMYTHQYGKGKVAGIVMGHGPDIFYDKNYKLAFQRAALWLAGAQKITDNNNPAKNEKIALAYVTSWSSIIPDPAYLTHINYAFGHVSNTFDGVGIANEDRLKQIVELKKQKPTLKILLSIGGWGSGRFSEMAADEKFRRSFAKDCKRVVDEFGLNGIDIDWEYPTANMAGISASPADKDNFTLMMKNIREEIGKDKLLTLATAAGAQYIDFNGINPYIDFVNIMSYDMGNPPYHHSGLYRSEHTGGISVDEAVKAHISAGIPAHKLVMGIPFYGRGRKDIGNFTNYKNIITLNSLERKWDDVAKAPYLSSDSIDFVCGYDDPRSIAVKCEYIIEKGMLGAMYWDYDGDDSEGTLRKAVYNGIARQ